MSLPEPFADDGASASIHDLTVENGREQIALYGTLDITCDKAGLETARTLAAYLQAVVRALESRPALPDRLPPAPPPTTVRNPFR